MKNLFIMTVTLLMLTASMTNRAGLEGRRFSVGKRQRFRWPVGGGRPSGQVSSGPFHYRQWRGLSQLLVHDTYFATCNGRRGIAQGTREVPQSNPYKWRITRLPVLKPAIPRQCPSL
jgi:hypothetical protein